MLVDRVYTSRMLVIRSTPFGWNGTYLQFDDAIPGLVGLKGFNPGERLVGAHLLELSGRGPEHKQVAADKRVAQFRLRGVDPGRDHSGAAMMVSRNSTGVPLPRAQNGDPDWEYISLRW